MNGPRRQQLDKKKEKEKGKEVAEEINETERTNIQAIKKKHERYYFCHHAPQL